MTNLRIPIDYLFRTYHIRYWNKQLSNKFRSFSIFLIDILFVFITCTIWISFKEHSKCVWTQKKVLIMLAMIYSGTYAENLVMNKFNWIEINVNVYTPRLEVQNVFNCVSKHSVLMLIIIALPNSILLYIMHLARK